MHQKILVTGGAGFIGKYLVDKLMLNNHDVIIFDNLSSSKPFANGILSKRNPKFILGDLRNYQQVERVIKGIDIIFHLGAQSNVLGAQNDMDYCMSTNVNGTYNILRAAEYEGIRRLIFTSSREVYGDSLRIPVNEEAPMKYNNFYGASKAFGEAYCQLFKEFFHLPIVILRLSNVYGPGDIGRVIPLFIMKAKEGKTIDVFGGSQILDFIWVETVIDAMYKSMTYPVEGETINIGSGRGISILELAETIIDLTNSPSKIRILPKNDIETQKYVSDISKMRLKLDSDPQDNFIMRLNDMLHN